jgi:DeoR family transcriptional regulator, glycerol-3-phosphate regulon repressor
MNEIISPRQKDIITLARTQGRVSVEELAAKYAVTPQTIRKDLNELCDRHLMSRVHGGAMVAFGVENVAYEARRSLAAAEKRAIGEATGKLIPNNCSLFINIGTTTEEVARALTGHEDLLVITNNLNVAQSLYRQPSIEVVLAGGPVRRADGAVIGAAAVDFIKQFRVDYAIVGTSAIEADGSLLDFDVREVQVSKAIIENARRTILVSDKSKFGRSAPVRIGHISDVDAFVTDAVPSEDFRALCRDHDVEVIEVGPHSGDLPANPR